jgi:TRAP-type uncharacterized transport system fused permease subunit
MILSSAKDNYMSTTSKALMFQGGKNNITVAIALNLDPVILGLVALAGFDYNICYKSVLLSICYRSIPDWLLLLFFVY